MVQRPQLGLFALSVDVRGDLSKQQITGLLQTLRRVRTPATLSLPSPGAHELVSRALVEPLQHDFAILADPSWASQQAGRTKFARELARRVNVATSNGIDVRTLALDDTELTGNLDLLVKHRISIVRSHSQAGFQPQSLRFGIWQAPVSFSLPSASRWSLVGVEWAVSRALSKAAKARDLVHIVTDANALSDPSVYSTLDRILTLVQKRQAKGQITAVTLGGLVDSLTPQRRKQASRSVLRVA
ncbi:MAG: hypothetical protein CMJ64_10585 [Planctomycetaceae bacterium]|nr:hypothetical protein [Planctomycetaceae bacterium]